MLKDKIILGLVILLLLISGGIYIYYGVLFKISRNIESEKPTYSISAEKLMDDYNENPQKADGKYLNKTIEIKGRISSVTDSILVFQNSIFCLLNNPIKNDLIKNNNVVVKGKCIGYDELFEEVKLDQCTIIKTLK